MCTYIDITTPSCIFQLHNPYLATPLSIEAYRHATSSTDQHRQNVIAWLDRLQSSVPSSPAKTPFLLDTPAGKGSSLSEESDNEQALQKHVQPRHGQPNWEHAPASSNTLVESDIDPYPVAAAPIGLLASFAINAREATVLATDKRREENTTGNDNDIVRICSCLGRRFLQEEIRLMRPLHLFPLCS